jgi:hypothetical protein
VVCHVQNFYICVNMDILVILRIGKKITNATLHNRLQANVKPYHCHGGHHGFQIDNNNFVEGHIRNFPTRR